MIIRFRQSTTYKNRADNAVRHFTGTGSLVTMFRTNTPHIIASTRQIVTKHPPANCANCFLVSGGDHNHSYCVGQATSFGPNPGFNLLWVCDDPFKRGTKELGVALNLKATSDFTAAARPSTAGNPVPLRLALSLAPVVNVCG